MQRTVTISLLLTLVFLVVGCKGLGIVQLSPDTYMASKTSGAGIYKSMAKLKEEVISGANAFAERKGKIAIPLSAQETPAAPFRNPSFEYQFRVIDKNDPEARRTALVPRANLVIEKNEKASIDIRTKDETNKQPDLYTELNKLDDLRKRGIITDAEFDAQKQKLLNSSK